MRPRRSSLDEGIAMTLLALDLGTKTGWALDGDPVAYGMNDFTPKRLEGGGMRFLRFERFLAELHAIRPLSEIVFEEVRRHRGTDASHIYGGFLSLLTVFCEKHSIPYAGVPVGTIKKFATGKGNADKAAMIAAVADLGYPVSDDNVADAIALLLCHKARL